MKILFTVVGVLVVGIITAIVVAIRFADDPAILICEEALKDTLKSPKSYQRVQSIIQNDTVHVSYDAANSYGALLRGNFSCQFKTTDGSTAMLVPFGLDEVRSETEQLKIDGAKAKTWKEIDDIANRSKALQAKANGITAQALNFLVRDHGNTEYPIPLGSTAVKPISDQTN